MPHFIRETLKSERLHNNHYTLSRGQNAACNEAWLFVRFSAMAFALSVMNWESLACNKNVVVLGRDSCCGRSIPRFSVY